MSEDPQSGWRFSLRDLCWLTLTVLFALGWLVQFRYCADQASAVTQLHRENALLHIKAILWADIANEKKAELLAPYVKLGDSFSDVALRLGDRAAMYCHGPGFCEHDYSEFGLKLWSDPDGEIYEISYDTSVPGSARPWKTLASIPGPVTWPKTPQVKESKRNQQPADSASTNRP